jgi:hypothetical protein
MAIETGFETDVNYTFSMDFQLTDLEDLGEVGIINESLSHLLAHPEWDFDRKVYAVKRFASIQAKVNVAQKATVILFGKLELDGLIGTYEELVNV